MSALVSILIPAYHSSGTIRMAIESCLKQSYDQFELIVLNNSPMDATEQLVNSIADSRIQYHQNAIGKSISESRNQLLRMAKGEYIAWLDADDEMLENRLEKQVSFLDHHPEIDLVGSWILTDNDALPSKQLPLKPDQIRSCLWFKNCMIQPAMMSRNFYKEENIWYDESYANSVEDYELWYRLRNIKKFYNLPEYLSLYHLTTGSELETKRLHNAFEQNIAKLWEKKWADMSLNLSDYEKSTFVRFIYENFTPNSIEFKAIKQVLDQLKILNKDRFFRLLIAYHKLRLFRNANNMDKLKHLYMLADLLHWNEFKRKHLI